MRLSKRGEYALRALIDLGLANGQEQPLVSARELACKESIPVKFLEQILVQLRGAGFVDSRRGKQGGYKLRRPPTEIVIGDVVRLIDGPLAPIRCVSQTAYVPCTCPDEETCGLRLLMLDVRNSISDILDRYTLAELVASTGKQNGQPSVGPALGSIRQRTAVRRSTPIKSRRSPREVRR